MDLEFWGWAWRLLGLVESLRLRIKPSFGSPEEIGQVGLGPWSKIILLCSGSSKGHNLVAETTLETLAFG